jgi:hypothetical protein
MSSKSSEFKKQAKQETNMKLSSRAIKGKVVPVLN